MDFLYKGGSVIILFVYNYGITQPFITKNFVTKKIRKMKTIETLRSLGFSEKAIKHIIKNSIENWIFSYEL